MSSADFFQNYLFQKIISGIPSRVSSSMDPDQVLHFDGPDLGPNCLQGYQQMTLVNKELKMRCFSER